MHFIIHCLDRENGGEIRRDKYDDHKRYLDTKPIHIVMSGPLLASDNATSIGSAFVVETETMEQATAFHRNDPFTHAGLWDRVDINPFLKRIDNR